MSTRLIIEGNAVYEIDEDCQACRQKRQRENLTQESCGVPEKKKKTSKKQ